MISSANFHRKRLKAYNLFVLFERENNVPAKNQFISDLFLKESAATAFGSSHPE